MSGEPKPLVMTLGKALSVLQKRGLRLVPPEEGTDSWGTTRIANWDAPHHEFGTWQEAVSDALGRTVVDADAPACDDAAELRAALEGLVPVALALTDLAVSGFDLPPGTVTAIAKARAALAATEGSE